MRALAALFLFAAITAIAACHGFDINEPPTPDGIDSLTFTPPTAMADGNAVVELTLADTNPLPSDLKVALTTTVGTFLGSAGASITVTLDTTGHAYAQLKAPSGAGTAIVAATEAGVTRYFNVLFSPAASAPVSKGVTALTLSSSSAAADGATTVTIAAVVDTQPRPSPYTVTFTTSAGTFLGSASSTPSTITIPVDAAGLARAQLRAPNDSAVALVTVTAGSVTRDTTILFAPAPPTAVQLSGDFAVKAGAVNSAAISAQLSRLIGTPSPGVTVRFTADSAGGSGGAFGQFSPRGAVTGASPVVSTRFSAGETSYRGRVTVRVQATRAGVTVTDSTVIQVVSP